VSRALLIVGPGFVDLSPYSAEEPYEIHRYERAETFAELRDVRFDVVVFAGFPEALPEPRVLLAEVARTMNEGARFVATVPSLVRTAVRVAVFGGSVGENVAPVVTNDDVAIYGLRSLAMLFEEAGFRVTPAGPAASILHGVLDAVPSVDAVPGDSAAAGGSAAVGGSVAAGGGLPAGGFSVAGVLFPEPTVEERLAFAEREVAELRAFFGTIHDNQRRLHEETARLRSMLGAREVELDVLRTETWELRRKTTVVVEDGSALVRALESDVARQRATIADLEARNVRLREALAELRDRALLPLP
jgi:hypothetical protein